GGKAPGGTQGPVAELAGLRGHALRLVGEARLDPPGRPRELLGGDRRGLHALDLVEQRGLELRGGYARSRSRRHVEQEWIAEAWRSGIHAGGELRLHEGLVQPAGA